MIKINKKFLEKNYCEIINTIHNSEDFILPELITITVNVGIKDCPKSIIEDNLFNKRELYKKRRKKQHEVYNSSNGDFDKFRKSYRIVMEKELLDFVLTFPQFKDLIE